MSNRFDALTREQAQASAPPQATVDSIAVHTSCVGQRPRKTDLRAKEQGFALLQPARDQSAAKRAEELAATTEQSTSKQKESDSVVPFKDPGRMSLPAFCQAPMACSSWDCVKSFGDWKSRFTTECQRTSEMSSLESLAQSWSTPLTVGTCPRSTSSMG